MTVACYQQILIVSKFIWNQPVSSLAMLEFHFAVSQWYHSHSKVNNAIFKSSKLQMLRIRISSDLKLIDPTTRLQICSLSFGPHFDWYWRAKEEYFVNWPAPASGCVMLTNYRSHRCMQSNLASRITQNVSISTFWSFRMCHPKRLD